MKNLVKILIILAFLFTLQAGAYAQVDRAIDAAKRGDYVTALNLFKSAGKIDDDYDVNYWYGRTLFETGSIEDAEKHYKIALKDDDEGWEALKGMGDLLSYQKKYDDANSYYKRAAKENDENISILIAQGRNLSKAGKLEDAVVVLTRATTISTNNADVYAGLGDAYFYGGATPAAVENYKKSLQIKNNAAAHFGLGNVYFKQRKFQDALEEFQAAVAADANFADAYLELGRLLYYNDDYTAALNAIEKYNALRPGDLYGLSYKGKILYAMDNLTEADKILDEVLALDPKNETAFKYKGYIASKNKNYDKAIEFFQKVPDEYYESDDYIIYAETYEKMGDFTQAYNIFSKGIAKDPEDYDVYYEWGEAQFNNKEYDAAIESFNKAIELGYNNAYIYKGLSYFNQNKYPEAIEAFDKAAEIFGDSYSIIYLLRAKSKYATGDKEGAIADYQKVLEIEPDNQDAQNDLKFLQGESESTEG